MLPFPVFLTPFEKVSSEKSTGTYSIKVNKDHINLESSPFLLENLYNEHEITENQKPF